MVNFEVFFQHVQNSQQQDSQAAIVQGIVQCNLATTRVHDGEAGLGPSQCVYFFTKT